MDKIKRWAVYAYDSGGDCHSNRLGMSRECIVKAINQIMAVRMFHQNTGHGYAGADYKISIRIIPQ